MNEYNRQREQSPNKAQARNALLNWKRSHLVQPQSAGQSTRQQSKLLGNLLGNSLPLHTTQQEAEQTNRTVN